ncbi:hypothetical protein [Reyranella sp.]|jgi:hypothetical protein|uniref:hypothetical protein n=1 Tax=Reyranella sp. TaxID=1929291 RepID=UPI000BD24448|nr:hypothetical protein [Reyranella sp.]OYY44024.1 MAG: hypothetical protein B7Y57_07520 [Rhodospirillales bacterium 35-66-84]OYZ94700.1 MAG: hypothetical protein B7Y08_10400 [Rhodospirillales bacterium 24-66-33]OZB26226.1 MAG: hypothetical protein B7X63_09810 [Rhodospirillales bacterium 39-66-50]HQS15055.1 hypothetical protein [Reyranella sp.]HQT10864.1 hypothetical protein [Reyranella sp.]
MTIFAILTPAENPQLGSDIARLFPENHFQVAPNQWLVAASGTTAKEVSDKLDITEGGKGKALIISVGNYYGRHSTDLWEWIKAKWDLKPNG